MKLRASRSGFASQSLSGVIAILCFALLSPGYAVALAQETQPQNAAPEGEAPKIPTDQLDSLVAPIALYPDSLLSQTLVASTYPLEIVQLQQWLEKNKNLKGKTLADAVEKQNWDPSIQAMAAFPDVVKRMADNITWTSDLGNAFLAQESDVMDAVQGMRAKAQGTGNLKTSAQQKVETQTVEGGKQVIVVQQANPDVVYVPSYDPTVVYGAPAYPYPPISYPPPGYYAAGAAIAFGTGVALGAAWGGGGAWGWGCGWSHGDVNVNVNNKYVNNYNKNNYNKANFNKQGGTWQHNPQHRGGAPYSNKATANKYGGTARGGGQAGARQGQGQMGGRQQPGGGAGTANRPGGGGAGTANRPGGGGGGERIGNRQLSGGSGGRGNNAFGSGGGGMNRSSAMASHNRGSHSMGASRGGGGARGGGGHRGGGGRRR
jgi:hypothetical protein